MPAPLPSFFCNKGEKRTYFSYKLQSIIEKSWGRSSKQEPRKRNTAYWLASCFCQLIALDMATLHDQGYYISQIPSPSVSKQEMTHRHALMLICLNKFLSWGFFFPGVSNWQLRIAISITTSLFVNLAHEHIILSYTLSFHICFHNLILIS